jgi:hypothetical protein
MDFDDCDYTVQQVPARSREEKVLNKDRDMVEKSRLAARIESFARYQAVDNIIKPCNGSSCLIDDVERFNRDYTEVQRATKRHAHDRTLARAASRHVQQVDYEEAIEARRRKEAEDFAQLQRHVAQHDFGRESVLYDPVTCVLAPETTDKGATQRKLDARRETFREARARNIQRNANSTPYDPVSGEPRTFW